MKFSVAAIVGLLGTALAAPLEEKANNEALQQGFSGPGVYIMSSVRTNSVIDLAGGRAQDGTAVAGWELHGGKNQQWQVADAGNNEYLFLNVAAGTYLTANKQPTNGVIHTTGNLISPTSKRARWSIKPGSTDGALVIASAADPRKVLDLKESNPKDGTPIIAYQATGNLNQQWVFHRV